MGLIGNLNVTGYAFFQFFDYAITNASALQAQLSCSQIECKGFARFSARVGASALRTSGA